MSILNAAIVVLVFTPVIAVADIACFEAPPEFVDIDEKFEKANVVFVATVTREKENEAILSYELHEPALKGKAPPKGEVIQNNLCWSMPLLNDSAVIVFFLESIDSPVTVADWQLVTLGENEPGMAWVSDWLAEKLRNLGFD